MLFTCGSHSHAAQKPASRKTVGKTAKTNKSFGVDLHCHIHTPEADTIAQQISIESAQPRLDLGVLKDLAGKKIMLGVLDLNDPAVETPEQVAARIRAGLKYVSPRHLVPAPDCGMKYLPREVAFAKLRAMVAGAQLVRAELGG